MKCCGHDQTTPFCAYCGVRDSPLAGLLEYVHAGSLEAWQGAARYREAALGECDIRARGDMWQRYDNQLQIAKKWDSWETALRANMHPLSG